MTQLAPTSAPTGTMAWAVMVNGEIYAVRRFEPTATGEHGGASFVPLVAAGAAPAALKHWRDLALQFDRHRMQALHFLKATTAPAILNETLEGAKAFLAAPPMPGNQIVEEHAHLTKENQELKAQLEAANVELAKQRSRIFGMEIRDMNHVSMIQRLEKEVLKLRSDNVAPPVTTNATQLLGEEELRKKFESMAKDSWGFRRSARGTYVNTTVARDWKWFQKGAQL